MKFDIGHAHNSTAFLFVFFVSLFAFVFAIEQTFNGKLWPEG